MPLFPRGSSKKLCEIGSNYMEYMPRSVSSSGDLLPGCWPKYVWSLKLAMSRAYEHLVRCITWPLVTFQLLVDEVELSEKEVCCKVSVWFIMKHSEYTSLPFWSPKA